MSKRTNTPIGEVACPHKGCTQLCKVYKFRPRTEGRKTVFSGKHYAECSMHGRIGSDGNPAVTNYILTEGKIWGATDRTAPQKSDQKSAPAQTPARKTLAPTTRSAPARTPESKASKPSEPLKSRWWEPVI